MEKLEEKYISLLTSDKKASDKFWELERKINSDKKKPGVMLMLKRSDAIFQIARMLKDKTITPADIEDFSEELKEAIMVLCRF